MERNGISAAVPAPTRAASGRIRWSLWGVLLALLMAWVVPAPQIRLGARELQGLVGSYLYVQWYEEDIAVQNLRVTDIYLPKTIRIAWDDAGEYVYRVTRYHGQVNEYVTETTDNFFVDTFPFVSGDTYRYEVRVIEWENPPSSDLPPPPDDANPEDIYYQGYPSGDPPVTISVVPMEIVVTDNQTADSRLDLRYGNPTLLNFRFGSRTYRGGLYAGNSQDPSRVGRSFLKFELPQLPVGSTYWTGSVNAYSTRSLNSGTTEIACQALTDITWSAANLNWSNAPQFTPSSSTYRYSFTYDANAPQGQWATWKLEDEIWDTLTGTGILSLGLGSTNENSGGWVYFAKKEYDAALGARVLYAYEP